MRKRFKIASLKNMKCHFFILLLLNKWQSEAQTWDCDRFSIYISGHWSQHPMATVSHA